MKKSIAILSIVSLVAVVYSCKKSASPTATGTAYLDLPTTLYSYFNTGGMPDSMVGSPNHIATLGRVLFYDTHLSMNNAISCGSCHKQAYGFADNAALSTGFQGKLTKRNSIAITDVSQKSSFFWDGRETNLANLAFRPLTNHVEMGIEDYNVLSQKLAALPYYTQLFVGAFGDGQITAERISQSIAMFMRAITSDNTRLDQFTQGNAGVLTAQELEGKFLFDTKYNCGSCHNQGGNGGSGGYGGGFNDTSFIDNGLDKDYTDMGRGVISGRSFNNGGFKVPDLHNVALTAPYMHDGRFKTLNDVMDHYSHGISQSVNLDPRLEDNMGKAKNFNITEPDKQAIIAFLGTLTDSHTITDPKFSNPFKVK